METDDLDKREKKPYNPFSTEIPYSDCKVLMWLVKSQILTNEQEVPKCESNFGERESGDYIEDENDIKLGLVNI